MSDDAHPEPDCSDLAAFAQWARERQAAYVRVRADWRPRVEHWLETRFGDDGEGG